MGSTTSWSKSRPDNATGLELDFAPTRTRIVGVDWGREGLAPDSDADFEGLHVSLNWGPEYPKDVALSLRYEGERLQPFHYNWRTPEGWAFPVVPEPYKELHNRREEVVEQDPNPAHAFFFELDRQTLAEYMPCVPELTPEERESRKKALECLHPMLTKRLAFRMDNLGFPPDPVDRPDLVPRFSTIFWKATSRLFPSQPHVPDEALFLAVGEALERFAAGRLRKPLTFLQPNLESVVVSEPDSFFVYFFAEFATVAIQSGDPEAARWAGILESAVRMQRFFIERYRIENPQCPGLYPRVVDYSHEPVCFLEEAQFVSLQQSLVVSGANHQISKHLNLMANKFGLYPGVPEHCAPAS